MATLTEIVPIAMLVHVSLVGHATTLEAEAPATERSMFS